MGTEDTGTSGRAHSEATSPRLRQPYTHHQPGTLTGWLNHRRGWARRLPAPLRASGNRPGLILCHYMKSPSWSWRTRQEDHAASEKSGRSATNPSSGRANPSRQHSSPLSHGQCSFTRKIIPLSTAEPHTAQGAEGQWCGFPRRNSFRVMQECRSSKDEHSYRLPVTACEARLLHDSAVGQLRRHHAPSRPWRDKASSSHLSTCREHFAHSGRRHSTG